MMIPTVHLNGTSKERLIEALCEASHALNEAYEKLKEAAPNGRDFYPQGVGAIYKATDEHSARLRKIDEVKKEIDDLAFAISQNYPD